jgi:hypothetical protein
MAQFKQWFYQDLTENIVVRHCESVMFTGDDKGAVVGVRLYDNGVAYSGGGTVSGAVKRYDGGLVALTGTLSDNAASVVIPAAALACPGPIGVRVTLTQGGSVTTVLKSIYSVDDTTGAAVDPGTIIPSINDLITAINTAVASIPSDYSALLHTLAPDFSASTAYYVGDYVWYNGSLYRFTVDHAAGTWVGTDATAAVIGNDVSDLKSAANDILGVAVFAGTDATDAGITYDWDGISCTVNGTATNKSWYNCITVGTVPSWLELGAKYELHYHSKSGKVIFAMYYTTDGSNYTNLGQSTGSITEITVPSNATGFIIRLVVNNGNTIDHETVTPILIKLDEQSPYIPRLALNNLIESYVYGQLPYLSGCDLNTVLDRGFWLLVDSETYTNTPNNKRAGFLEVQKSANWSLQLFYELATNKVYKRTFGNTTLHGPDWTLITGIENTYNNTYTYPIYNNTYNQSVSPSITTDTNAYLAPTGDTTDRTAAIVAMLNSHGVCRLGKGDYYVNNLTMPDHTLIIGAGDRTRVILSGTADGYAIKMGEMCSVSDMRIIGSTSSITLTETVGERHGILWHGNYSDNGDSNLQPMYGILSNLWISGFSGGGITCYNTGYGTKNHLEAVNIYCTNCTAGINIAYWSEFHKFTNCRTYSCYYGCINNGGNNVFVNCDFSSCQLAFLMDNENGQSPNNSHGSCVCCVFNHSGSNSGIGVKALNMANGFVFDGCQIFFSQIYLVDCEGFVFSSCNFGTSNCDITISGGASILFANNMHGSAPTVTITDNNDVKFVNCYVRGTGQAIRAESTGLPIGGTAGQYLRKKSGSDYDAEWKTPNGGEINVSGTDTRKVDEALNGLENEIGVVVTGNKTASGVAASVGQYVILKNSSITGKTDGLYKAAKAISAATAIDGTYLTAVSGGGLNSLDSAINSVEAKSLGNAFNSRSVSNPDFNNLIEPGVWFIGDMATATNGPGSIGWVTMLVLVYGGTIVQVIFGGRQSSEAKTRIWVRYRYQNEWKPWYYTQMQAV